VSGGGGFTKNGVTSLYFGGFNVHIDGWWKNVGGSDDSLLLLDYFKANKQETYSLKKVLEDLHLYELLGTNSLTGAEACCYFDSVIDGRKVRCEFHFAIEAVINLCAILCESLYSKKVSMNDLLESLFSQKSTEEDFTFELLAEENDIRLIANEIKLLIENLQSYEIIDMMLEDEIPVWVDGCKEMYSVLTSYSNQVK
jgi:hypothetical protein